ncbi:MAG: DEAD/DEAH box helicase family protein, partial [Actinomycetota bacterium]|nr:DEAD/DEAH box helicase family protein [Actinomycetota bacterium]
MSSLIEYLATQGVRNVLVVTPNTTIQRKTLTNFDGASAKYVAGAEIAPQIITPENFQTASIGTALRDRGRLKVFVFNVQQLIRPTDNVSRRVREPDENLGGALYSHLEDAQDLFVIADEHHIYHERAQSFSGAVRHLSPVALVGLTATPDPEDVP